MAIKISSIEELIAVARGNQHIFRELNITNTYFKESIAEKYLADPGAASSRITKVNTYNLELLSVGVMLKKFRIRKEHPAWKAFLEKAKKIEFSINVEKRTRSKLQIQLEHYRNDKIEDIVEYIEEYAEHRLKKITSLWDVIRSFLKNTRGKIAPLFKDTWEMIAPFFRDIRKTIAPLFKDLWKIVTLLFKDTWKLIVPFFKDIWRKIALFFKNIRRRTTLFFKNTGRKTALFFKDTWEKIKLFLKNRWKRIVLFLKK